MSGSIWRYLLWRLAIAVPLVLGVVTITFAIVHLAPGDPVTVLLGDYPANPEYVRQLREQLGLERSLPEQYVSYLSAVGRGDFGFSFRNRRAVADLVLERLPATLLLMGSAMVFAAIVGVGLGVAASLRPYSLVDNLSSVVGIIGYSMPVFLIGQILLVVLAVELRWLPVQGLTSIDAPTEGPGLYADVGRHLVLPMVALSFRYLAVNARITRASMLEVFQRDFILTARAKGLPRRLVIWKHGLRNALLPIVTVIGFNFGFVLTGSVLVETVFGWPGIGRLLFESLGARDYPVMLAIFIVGAITAIAANLMTDLVYAALDPRIRY